MQTRTLAFCLLLALVSTAAFAQKVHVDYDPDYTREGATTFAWAKTPETSLAASHGLMHSRIVNAIEHVLGQVGLQQVDGDPDLYVTYHTNTEDKVRVDVDTWDVRYPGVWYRAPYRRHLHPASAGASVATVTTYRRGTLVIDIWDAKTDTMVWRGSVSGVVPSDPAQAAKKIEKAIDKMIKVYGKKKKKDAKRSR